MIKPPHVNAVSRAIAWAARALRGTPPFHGKGPLTRDEVRALESFNAEVARSWWRYLNREEPK